jgi:hypothetical protein
MKCPVCGYETEHFPVLARHVHQKHNVTPCPICGAKVRYLIKHAARCRDFRHQLLHKCLWPEPRRRHSRERHKRNCKPNGGRERSNGSFLDRIADAMDNCKAERGVRVCSECAEVLHCEIVEMLIERMAKGKKCGKSLKELKMNEVR